MSADPVVLARVGCGLNAAGTVGVSRCRRGAHSVDIGVRLFQSSADKSRSRQFDEHRGVIAGRADAVFPALAFVPDDLGVRDAFGQRG